MKVAVVLRQARTSEVQTYEYNEVVDIRSERILWLWTEGPYGCDCHRRAFFWLSKYGVPPAWLGKCGRDGYVLESLTIDGKELLAP